MYSWTWKGIRNEEVHTLFREKQLIPTEILISSNYLLNGFSEKKKRPPSSVEKKINSTVNHPRSMRFTQSDQWWMMQRCWHTVHTLLILKNRRTYSVLFCFYCTKHFRALFHCLTSAAHGRKNMWCLWASEACGVKLYFVSFSFWRKAKDRKKIGTPRCSTSTGKSEFPSSKLEVSIGTPPEVGFLTRTFRRTSPTLTSKSKMAALGVNSSEN